MTPAFWGPVGFLVVVGALIAYWIIMLGMILVGLVIFLGYLAISEAIRRSGIARRRSKPAWKGGQNPWKKGGPRSAAVVARARSEWRY